MFQPSAFASTSVLLCICWPAMAAAVFAGCAGEAPDTQAPADPPTRLAPVDTANPRMTPAELRRALGANENAEFRDEGGRITAASLTGSGVTDLRPLAGLPLEALDVRDLAISDLSPLAGLPLRELYAEDTQVRDLSPLAGLPLEKLYLSHAPVSDLSPLRGMTLEELNLVGTQVSDLEALGSVEVGTLWLRDTPVSDLTPLSGRSPVSLDLEGTPVADLTPLAGMSSLRRLNIARTAITDLTPLAGLQLERLTFTPSKIEQGLEAVRAMSSLTALGTRFEDASDTLPPDEFWQKLDAGEIRE